VLVGVVDVQHVDPVEPEAFQALLEGTKNAVVGEVEHRAHCGRGRPAVEPAGELAALRRRVGPQ
jgi:hypothetical protein